MRVAGNVVARALPAPIHDISAWWCELVWADADVEQGHAMLSDAEQARAARFGTPALRARYVTGRATLRMLLGRWLNVDPQAVPISRGPRGRPYVEATGAPDFNVSHTRDAALIAICTSARIGVDVERCDRTVDAAGLARKFLTDAEREAMGRLSDTAAREFFLRIWTCKEAMSKATGDGLAAPMSQLSVDATGGGLRLDAGPSPYVPADWSLIRIDAPATHMATAALWRPSTG